MSNNGVIYVASSIKEYFNYAIHSVRSLKDFSPDINATLFTHKKFLDGREKVFDNVITDIPIHHRAKMWCMARSPYDITTYIDSDTECWNTGFENTFTDLGDADIAFTVSPIYSAGNLNWTYADKEHKYQLRHQGGFCVYRKNELVIDFLQTWYDEYLKQFHLPWKLEEYNIEGKRWDMFTLWRLCNDKEFIRFKKLNFKEISPKYNYCVNYLPSELDKQEQPVMIHFSKGFVDEYESFKKIKYENNNEAYSFEKSIINRFPPKFN